MCGSLMMALGTFTATKLNKYVINKHLLVFGISLSTTALVCMFASCMNWIALSINYIIH